MEFSRSIPWRQKCAHVLRYRRRTILRTSTNLHDPKFSYDPSVSGSESTRDGKRIAERYIYKQKETIKKEEVNACPIDCIPECWLPVIKSFFKATDKRLLVIGRTYSRKRSIANIAKVKRRDVLFYVITQNINTGKYISGLLTVRNDRKLRPGNKLTMHFKTAMRKDPVENLSIRAAMHAFFGKYYTLFRLTFPDYVGTVVAPPFLLEPLIELKNE